MKTLKRGWLAGMAVALGLLLAGCGKDDEDESPIVGRWESIEDVQEEWESGTLTGKMYERVIFSDNGTFYQVNTIQGTIQAGSEHYHYEESEDDSGRWRLDGSTLVLTYSDGIMLSGDVRFSDGGKVMDFVSGGVSLRYTRLY